MLAGHSFGRFFNVLNLSTLIIHLNQCCLFHRSGFNAVAVSLWCPNRLLQPIIFLADEVRELIRRQVAAAKLVFLNPGNGSGVFFASK